MSTLHRRKIVMAGLAIGIVPAGWYSTGWAQTPPATPPDLRRFPTPEEAINALVDAIRKDDDKAVAEILGSGWQDFVPGHIEDEDEVRNKFLKAWDESHKMIPENDDRVLVGVGTTGWVLPIPIMRKDGSWLFDIEAGHNEVQARTIGHNELAVVQTLLAIIDAQRDYAARDPMNTGMSVYSRRLLSSPGNKDGLYWETKPGEPESPIGPRLALAQIGHVE